MTNQKLKEKRETAANKAFSEAELPEIAESKEWTEDGIYWSRKIFWENPDGGDSIIGSFGVQFKPDTDEIVDQWHQ